MERMEISEKDSKMLDIIEQLVAAGVARGIKQGDKVVVYNDRGQHPTVAIVNDDILPGVLCLENGWWMGQNGFNSSSVLTNDTVEVLGTGTSICSTLVDVKKA